MKGWISRLLPNFNQSFSIRSENPTRRVEAPYDIIRDDVPLIMKSTSHTTHGPTTTGTPIDQPLLTKISRTRSIIIPFEPRYLNIVPNLHKVAQYDILALRDLIKLAESGDQSIELLLAFHRTMAIEMQHGHPNRYDCILRETAKLDKRVQLLRAYDEKFGIRRKADVLDMPRPRTPVESAYTGPI
ncbi:hypothetical protein GLAREA_12794 [Glarea lozoyensis ATCC 20868]|uniref:Uncharacterized protein n=1 Tax=Glarea lozoyensis (strain ATCC 20868 / MF5171) TaxID=1116229 RepID=S3DDK3_GLAL2|nr:uncharacterized protein GLAREA_12794 [Glarea lozoyensis ATCC 20868]EPE30071.1 hypothetical protein GLAREA_12794 [Glarea lozoyensis ATCC 20868]